MNVFDLAMILGAIGIVVIGGAAVATSRKYLCPACSKRGLVVDTRHHAGGIELATGGRIYRCTLCATELVRRHDRGPFVPRPLWDAGAREALPSARALPKERA